MIPKVTLVNLRAPVVATVLVVLLSSCGGAGSGEGAAASSSSGAPTASVAASDAGGSASQNAQPSPTTPGSDEEGAPLPAADPAFARHFTDPVYEDQGGEFAPFGTDEGWDMLYEWAERRSTLDDSTTVADLLNGTDFGWVTETLDEPEGPGIPEPAGQVDAATIMIGAGFTLLRLTGHIDDEGRRQTLKALDILIRRYGSPPEMVRQRDDLLSWRN